MKQEKEKKKEKEKEKLAKFYVIVTNCLKHSREFEIPGGRGFSFYLGLEGFYVKIVLSFSILRIKFKF